MLVLSRKVGEEILIGGHVVVSVQRIDGNRVSIGVDAPLAVRVVRKELVDREDPNHPEYREIAPDGP